MAYLGENSLKKILTLIKDYLNSKFGNVENKSSATIRSEITKANVTSALGYTPPTTNTTYEVATSSVLGLVKSGTDITVDSNGNVSVNDDSHNHVISNVDGLQSTLDSKAPLASPTLTGTPKAPTATVGTNTTQIATTAFVQTAVANLVGSAPDTLNTLGELAIAIEEHQDVTDALDAAITNKVDKISGKGLSTNDYTTTEKTKLSGIATGAEVNQNAFSNVVVGSTTITADSKTDSLTLAGSNVTLTPDATNDIVTIGITKANVVAALGYTPPTSDTNTHYSSKNVVGSSTATSNTTSALTNGNVYLNSVENGSVTSTHKISGSGATTVTTDASGNIVISSTDNNTTYSNMTAATSSAAGKAGLVPAPSAGSQAKFLRGDGTWQTPTNTTYSNFVKSGSGAKAGLVPAPSTTAGTTKYLREDGTWAVPPDTNTTYSLSSFGLTATATELNYCDGVTSNIQTQLNTLTTNVNNCFQSASNSKSLLASAITGKGVTTASDATYQTMANNIGSIPSIMSDSLVIDYTNFSSVKSSVSSGYDSTGVTSTSSISLKAGKTYIILSTAVGSVSSGYTGETYPNTNWSLSAITISHQNAKNIINKESMVAGNGLISYRIDRLSPASDITFSISCKVVGYYTPSVATNISIVAV